ncbi:hypothetical protein F5Y05DRAFT_372081 [Hypoxylon sp. FL0543]|nr:hypothetical protein F5Y05DRAFT_372081 [Hypoxylon sp. FL0543]
MWDTNDVVHLKSRDGGPVSSTPITARTLHSMKGYAYYNNTPNFTFYNFTTIIPTSVTPNGGRFDKLLVCQLGAFAFDESIVTTPT